MKTFLQNLSEHLVQLGEPLEKMVVVMPNRRARRMLTQALSTHFNKPFFAPRIYAIDEFVATISPLKSISKLEQLVQLHQLLRSTQLNIDNADDFDSMLSWAPAFLDDISEVDKQMDNLTRILLELAQVKDFELRFGKDAIGEETEQKIRFYGMLSDLYVHFRDALRQQQLCYDGMLYRDCAEHIEQYASRIPKAIYIFAGFHVLNPTELKIVKYIKEHFDTHFFFDIDPFYCNFNAEPRFSTAHFLKKICSTLSLPEEKVLFQHQYYKEIEKDIEIVGTSKVMNQVYYAIQKIKEIEQRQGNLNSTALVLADEKMLLPFISTYDGNLPNITMGFPFEATPECSLLNHLLDMYQNALPYNLTPGQPMKYLHRDWNALIQNPLVQRLLLVPENKNKTIQQLNENTHALIDSSFFSNELLNAPLVPQWTSHTHSVLSSLADYFDKLTTLAARSNCGILYQITEALCALKETFQPISNNDNPLKIATLRFAIREQMKSVQIAIQGDATNGLQVMGLLETRTLDFDNIIMIGVNEGTLPSGISHNSIIPFDFKYSGETLESYLYKDQIYAYHFFRLLQRTKNVILTYNNDCTDSLAEKSRFISQLEFEVTRQQLEGTIHLSHPTVYIPLQTKQPEKIKIAKTENILQQLADFEYSATAMNTYVKCPLQFYLKHLCNLKPPTTFKEKIENNVIGTLVHAIFEYVFNQIKETPKRTQTIIEQAINDVDTLIRNQLLNDEKSDFSDADLLHGRLFLATQIVRHEVVNYLKAAQKELASGTIQILENEKKMHVEVQVPKRDPNGKLVPNAFYSLKVKGIIDRIQVQDGILTVVDYKTGSMKDAHLKIASDQLDNIFTNTKYDKLLQLLVYALLCNKDSKYNKYEKLQCVIVAIQEANKQTDTDTEKHICKALIEDCPKDKKLKNSREIISKDDIAAVTDALTQFLADVMNPTLPFLQTDELKSCSHCDFKYYCRR